MTDADKQQLAELARQLIRESDALSQAENDFRKLAEVLEMRVDDAGSRAGLVMKRLGLSFVYVDGRVIRQSGEFAITYGADQGFATLP